MDAQIERADQPIATSERTDGLLAQAPREALDREEQLIRDSVLRMGALVEAAIREASRALAAHDAALRARRDQGRRDHQRGAARQSRG